MEKENKDELEKKIKKQKNFLFSNFLKQVLKILLLL